jgi:hypothetical protein
MVRERHARRRHPHAAVTWDTTWDTTMPRYFFHLTDGKNTLDNHQGLDLAGNAAAREAASDLTRDLRHGEKMPGWNWKGWFVVIVDQHGHKVDELPVVDSLEGE